MKNQLILIGKIWNYAEKYSLFRSRNDWCKLKFGSISKILISINVHLILFRSRKFLSNVSFINYWIENSVIGKFKVQYRLYNTASYDQIYFRIEINFRTKILYYERYNLLKLFKI